MTKQAIIKKISIVIPVLNEEEVLPELIRRSIQACEQTKRSYEIVFIDDGSTDSSRAIITQAAQVANSNCVAVILNRNYGQHSALIAGFKVAKGDLIFTLDADLQNMPEDIPKLLAAADQGYDIVHTIRKDRDDSWLRKLLSFSGNWLLRKLTAVKITDCGSMLRAYRRNVVDAVLMCNEHSTFLPLLAHRFASKTTEIYIAHESRKVGESKYGLLKLINYFFDLITCVSSAPLRFLNLIGVGVAGLGFVFALLLLGLRIWHGPVWAGEGVFTLFSVLFIFIGFQFIGMGLLGEYIGRIYNDVRNRPRYFISNIYKDDYSTEQSVKKENIQVNLEEEVL